MRQRIFLSMLAVILAFAQVWAAPVDSLRINPRTNSIPNHLNSVELTEGNVLLNGLTPGSSGVEVTATSANNYTWDNLPSIITFCKPVGGSDRATITLYERSCYSSAISFSTTYSVDWAKGKNESGMFELSKQFINGQSEPLVNYYETTCIYTINYKPTAVGTHKATLVVKQYTLGCISPSTKTIEIVGTALNRKITPSETRLNFGNVAKGKSSSLTFSVTGTNLTGRIAVSSGNSNFTVSPSSLPASGGTVTVTYKPKTAGEHYGIITLSGGGAVSKTVSVYGTGVIPAITASPTTLAFGNVVKDKTASKTFTVTGTNLTGNLTVSSSNSIFTVSPATITAANAAAGQTVTVTYKPTATGSHSATITISGGGATSKTVTATGTGVVPTITPYVSSLAFGTVVKGNTASKTFTVTGTDLTGSLTVSSSKSSIFSVTPATITAAQAKAGATVTVTYKPTAAGSHSGTITISGGGATSKTVGVSGTCIDPKITTSVSSLAFGNVVKGNNPTKTFKVTGTDLTGSLTVSSNNSTYFTVSPTTITAAQAKAGATVTVTYKASAKGSHSATITVSGGGAESKTVSVTGTCIDPKITTSVSSLAFGNVVKDKTASKTFKVTGSDLTGSLTVSSSNSSIFTVSPSTITAAQAKAGATVTVTYKPTAEGSHSATITIKGGSAPNKTVSVSGTCVVPTITVSETSLLFAGYHDSRTLTVKGTNLTGSLTLSTNNSYFSVSPTTITVAEAKAGKTVIVTCNAAINQQRASGVLTISGGGASAKKVLLTFDATGAVPYEPLVEPDDENGEETEDEFNVGELEISQNGWNAATTDVDELVMNVKIYAEGGDIVIESPVEQSAVISDIAGRARRVNLQAGRNVIPVNASGVHIVRVGEKTAKLMLK